MEFKLSALLDDAVSKTYVSKKKIYIYICRLAVSSFYKFASLRRRLLSGIPFTYSSVIFIILARKHCKWSSIFHRQYLLHIGRPAWSLHSQFVLWWSQHDRNVITFRELQTNTLPETYFWYKYIKILLLSLCWCLKLFWHGDGSS